MAVVKRQLSEQAQVAKLCKKYISSLGVKCTAKSDSYSMGDSVRIEYQDINPETHNKIEEFCKKFQYGHFNGMEDIYECSNTRDDIPQTKFLFVSNCFSKELKQKAWEYLLNNCNFADWDGLPVSYDEARLINTKNFDSRADIAVPQFLRGQGWFKDFSNKFWSEL